MYVGNPYACVQKVYRNSHMLASLVSVMAVALALAVEDAAATMMDGIGLSKNDDHSRCDKTTYHSRHT